jgi:hypothetical protein
MSQISCTEAPSKVQTDASLCKWDKSDMTCSLAPPPSGPMFIIVVALLTIVMSIPIISLILFVLMRYASKQPKRGDTQKSVSDAIPSDKGPHRQEIAGEKLSFTNQSSFGKAMSRGSTGERAGPFAYAGAEIKSTYLPYAFVETFIPSYACPVFSC